MYQNSNDLRDDAGAIREAVRFGLTAVAVAIGFLVLAGLWVSTCAGDTADAMACGAPQRTLLALGAPLILLAAGAWALARTYRSGKRDGARRVWHGAGWSLITLMLIVLTMTLSSPVNLVPVS